MMAGYLLVMHAIACCCCRMRRVLNLRCCSIALRIRRTVAICLQRVCSAYKSAAAIFLVQLQDLTRTGRQQHEGGVAKGQAELGQGEEEGEQET